MAIKTPEVPPRVKYREEWLNQAMDLARDLFAQAGYSVPPNVRVTCGWPSKMALGEAKRRIGECWASTSSGDGTFEILISPFLDDGLKVLGVLIHEMVHATVGLEAKHGKPFKDCATAVGLTGKMTATEESEELQMWCAAAIENKLGRYPHSKLDGMTNGKKKAGTRMLKLECPDCQCITRTTQKWLDEYGTEWPCPCGGRLTFMA